MVNATLPGSFEESLLASGTKLTEADLASLRRRLKDYFAMASRKMARNRLMLIVMWSLLFFSILFMAVGTLPNNFAGMVVIAVFVLSFLVAPPLSIVYLFDRSRVSKAYQVERDLIMLEMQRKLDELSKNSPGASAGERDPNEPH